MSKLNECNEELLNLSQWLSVDDNSILNESTRRFDYRIMLVMCTSPGEEIYSSMNVMVRHNGVYMRLCDMETLQPVGGIDRYADAIACNAINDMIKIAKLMVGCNCPTKLSVLIGHILSICHLHGLIVDNNINELCTARSLFTSVLITTVKNVINIISIYDNFSKSSTKRTLFNRALFDCALLCARLSADFTEESLHTHKCQKDNKHVCRCAELVPYLNNVCGTVDTRLEDVIYVVFAVPHINRVPGLVQLVA
jgi:hypothetical protein